MAVRLLAALPFNLLYGRHANPQLCAVKPCFFTSHAWSLESLSLGPCLTHFAVGFANFMTSEKTQQEGSSWMCGRFIK